CPGGGVPDTEPHLIVRLARFGKRTEQADQSIAGANNFTTVLVDQTIVRIIGKVDRTVFQ
ncbi:hypothetical protein A2U01_0090132, partial [Trifolium medium]|nr:hypothetical protein [Trifolium medium]